MKDEEFDEQIKRIIRANFFMISSSADSQQSEETYNANSFELPNPAGKAGGACTSSFLQAMYENGDGATWVATLKQMREVLKTMGYNQIPQLTSSRLIDVNRELTIVPKGSGRRRALLIGINYVGQQGALTACHNDVNNLREFLSEVYGFKESEMLILMDDGKHNPPTRRNIEDGMIRLTRYSQPGDVAFVSFSGHGGNVVDTDGDEDDGFDETLIPVDFKTEGHIVDDDILKMLVKPMVGGVHVTVLMDCCHSGTVMDLPYTFGADDRYMSREEGFNMEAVGDGEAARAAKEEEEAKAKPKKKNRDLDAGGDGGGDGGGGEAKEEEEPPKDKSKDKKSKPKKTRKVTEEEKERAKNIVVGPKIGPDGAPALPIRKAPEKPPPPPNHKKCAVM